MSSKNTSPSNEIVLGNRKEVPPLQNLFPSAMDIIKHQDVPENALSVIEMDRSLYLNSCGSSFDFMRDTRQETAEAIAAKIEELEAKRKKEVDELREKHRLAMETMEANNKDAIDKKDQTHLGELNKLKTDHAAVVEQNQKIHNEALKRTDKKYDAAIKEDLAKYVEGYKSLNRALLAHYSQKAAERVRGAFSDFEIPSDKYLKS